MRVWPGGLCLSRSIGDKDVGDYIVPVPHVKQIRVSPTAPSAHRLPLLELLDAGRGETGFI